MQLAFLEDFGPVGILVLGAAVCAALDLRPLRALERRPALTRWVALSTLGLTILCSVGFWKASYGAAPPDIEHGSFLIDRFALFFYALGPAAAGAVVLCGADAEAELDPHRGVFHALLLCSCAGVLFTASAGDLVSLGAGLALTLLPLGLAQALRKTDREAVRTALRGISLSGLSLLLFLVGSAALAALGHSTQLRAIPNGISKVDPLLVVAALLLLLGALVPLGGFPYLWWRARAAGRLPSLPLLSATLLGALAASAALLRTLPGALGAAPATWELGAAILAALTLVLAPWLALRQRQLGEAVVLLLIAQLAVIPATLPEVSRRGTASILYLLLALVPLAAATLGTLASISAQGQGSSARELRGLWGRSPLLASALALGLAGLAGAPPLAGFLARLLTVDSAFHSGFGWLAWLELLSALLSCLVALRWLLTIFDSRVEGLELDLPQRTATLGIGVCLSALLAFAVLLGPLFGIASRAALAPLLGP